MTTLSRSKSMLLVPMLAGLGFISPSASAATAVSLKNTGPAAVQVGFDGGAPVTIAPGSTQRLTLNDGPHTAQCRYEGGYDGCNLTDSFTIAGAKEMRLNLLPIFTLEHAVALAKEGNLSLETRTDGWATSTLQVTGSAEDCGTYESGKLGAVSKRVTTRMAIRNATVATENLCGNVGAVIGTMVGGTQLYFHPRFVTFKDKSGNPVLVRQ